MREHEYAFGVGRIKVLETRLLDRARLERLADAADEAEARAQLAETEYAEALAAAKSPAEIAGAELIRVRDLLLGLIPDSAELRFLLWRWDLLNLKALMRPGDSGRIVNDLGFFRVEEIEGWLTTGRPEMPDVFAEARRAGENAYGSSRDPQSLDAAVDAVYYARGAALWQRWPGTFLPGYWQARIDLTNLRTLARARLLGMDAGRIAALLLPGGSIQTGAFLARTAAAWEEIWAFWHETPYTAMTAAVGDPRDLPALEKAVDNHLLDLIRPAKRVPAGIEPLLGYYLGKEHETRLVHLILAAKSANVPGDEIKERLRDVYA